MTFMKKKISFIFSLVVTTFINAQFYQVPSMEVKFEFNRKTTNFKVQAFRISDQINVRQFKEYLDAVKKDSTEIFYQAQLPYSGQFKQDLLEAILKNPELQDKAMPGVSWTTARNYCKWFSVQMENQSDTYCFDLPNFEELLAFQEVSPRKTDQLLECWTLDTYDESFMLFSGDFKDLNFRSFRQYDAKKEDPPSMKRKMIFGGSYFMKLAAGNDFKQLSYEYQDSSSRFIGFRIVKREKSDNSKSNITSETKTVTVKDLVKPVIRVKQKKNRIHGVYQEFYSNGQCKVKGNFHYGQRIGTWKVWDKKGNLILQREYTDNRNFKFVFPVEDHPYKKVYDQYPAFQYKRNKDSIFPWSFVEERSVAYSKRIWRELSTKNEAKLFETVDFKKLVESFIQNDIKWYWYGEYGDFKYKATGDSLQIIKDSYLNWDFSRIEIKEDFFFTTDLLRADTRQVGMNFFKNARDSIPTYTIYFPHARKILATFDLKSMNISNVKHLDDYFYFGAYRGEIINAAKYFQKENDKIIDREEELSKFVIEHENWINYGR